MSENQYAAMYTELRSEIGKYLSNRPADGNVETLIRAGVPRVWADLAERASRTAQPGAVDSIAGVLADVVITDTDPNAWDSDDETNPAKLAENHPRPH